jgi:hypothetical protein
MPDLTPDPVFEVMATDFMNMAQHLGTVGKAMRREANPQA